MPSVVSPLLRPVERLVMQAAREVQVLAASTPLEACAERERLVGDLRAGRAARPRWTYKPREDERLRRALDAAEELLTRAAESHIDALYLARVCELAMEADLCAAVGTRDVSRLALRRFAPADAEAARAASALCAAWLREPQGDSEPQRFESDDSTSGSLLSAMRETVGRLKLPFSVVAAPALASLAATGERTIFVATGRWVSPEDVARTVLHEVEGHARPRARSERATCPLFRAATARGTDDQEGRAVWLELRAGLLGPRRRRQLAARHRAVESMLDGATFPDVARAMVRELGLDPADAISIAERAFRGGDGERPGLGRERVYLESFVRVRAHLELRPEDEHVLASGQVAVDAVEVLRAYAPRQDRLAG